MNQIRAGGHKPRPPQQRGGGDRTNKIPNSKRRAVSPAGYASGYSTESEAYQQQQGQANGGYGQQAYYGGYGNGGYGDQAAYAQAAYGNPQAYEAQQAAYAQAYAAYGQAQAQQAQAGAQQQQQQQQQQQGYGQAQAGYGQYAGYGQQEYAGVRFGRSEGPSSHRETKRNSQDYLLSFSQRAWKQYGQAQVQQQQQQQQQAQQYAYNTPYYDGQQDGSYLPAV